MHRSARPEWAKLAWRDVAAPLLIVLAVLLAHAIELSGWLSSNPIYVISGLGTGSAPGPLAGVPGWVEFYAGATTQAMGRLDAYDWLRGVVPWWNPYVGVGMPLGAEMQSSPLFLPFVLLHVFFDSVMYLKITMQLIAGLATYALLRSLALGRVGAVTGGVLYALTGSFAWFSDAIMMPPAFLPLLLLGIERARAVARQGRPGGFCWIGVAITYLLLAGFPETAYLCGLFALTWTIFRFASDPASRHAFAVKVIGGGTIGLMIAAPCLLAFFHFLSLAWEQPRSFGHRALFPPDYAQYLFPYIFGPILYKYHARVWFPGTGGYIAFGSLFVGLAGLFGASRERGLRWLLLAWIAICLAKISNAPLITDAVNLLPAITETVFQRYVTPTIAFAVAILSAFAIDDMRKQDWQGARWRSLVAFLVCATLGLVAVTLALPELRVIQAAGGTLLYPLASTIGGFSLIGILARLCLRPASAPVAAFLMMLEAGVLFALPLLSGTPKGALNLGPVDFLRQHLGQYRYYSVGPLGPNYGSYFRLRSIDHNYAPIDAAWGEYAAAHVNATTRISIEEFNGIYPNQEAHFRLLRAHPEEFMALGVKYVVAYRAFDPYGDLGSSRPTPAYQDNDVVIYELPNPAPYVQVDGDACTFTVDSQERITGTCRAPAYLVRRELFFPGWRATLNGKPAAIGHAGELFQSVALPAGDFTLRFHYAPPFINAAYALCLAGLLWLGVGAWVGTGKASWPRWGVRLPPRGTHLAGG